MAVSIGTVIALIKALGGSGGGSGGGGVQDVKVDGASVVDSSGNANITMNPQENVIGSTPSITGVSGVRYVCGEVSTISIAAPASGCIDVVFESGSTAAVMTLASAKTGVMAIRFPAWFDPDNLEANKTYEISILDGEFGAVMAWA